MGQQLIILDVDSDRDIDDAFATLVQRGADALLAGTGSFMFWDRLVALAAAITENCQSPNGHLFTPAFSNARSPPTCRSTPQMFRVRLNLKTAKTLGLDVPDRLLALADEVIE